MRHSKSIKLPHLSIIVALCLFVNTTGCALIMDVFPHLLSNYTPPLYKGLFAGEVIGVSVGKDMDVAILRVNQRPDTYQEPVESYSYSTSNTSIDKLSNDMIDDYFEPDLFLLINIDQEPIDPSVFEENTIKFRGRAIFTDVGVIRRGLPKTWGGEKISENTAIMILGPVMKGE